MGAVARVCCALGATGALVAMATPAGATEGQWRLGADGGLGIVGLPEATVGGWIGGAHATYGATDAWNLRLDADVGAYALPLPALGGWVWGATAGLEYVIDILDWVPTLGALAGPVGIYRQGDGQTLADRHDVYLGLDFPLGLGYAVLPELLLGVEGRYRLLVVGTDVGPISSLMGLARAEYVWGP